MSEMHGLLIGGCSSEAESGDHFSDHSPVTGEVIGEFAAAQPVDACRAVDVAAQAGQSWARTSFTVRRAILLRAADILEADRIEHRTVFAMETGGVAAWADMNVMEAAATLREAAGVTSTPIGSVLPSHDPSTRNISERGPAGVVLAIVPWNAPLVLAARSIAIALAVGNTVVLRPSELAPITAGHLLAGALERAGLPPGVVNVVTTAPEQGRTAIEAMIAHPAVRRVVFIGSTPVGRSIAAAAAAHLTPTVLELGGKNATIVLEDADLDTAVPMLAVAAFTNSGQVCMCTDRILVHRSIAGELAERLAATARRMTTGDPRDAGTDLGPLINGAAADRFHRLVADGVRRGARVLSGGIDMEGLFARATVVADLPGTAELTTQESFAPIVTVHAVDSDDEAIALANDTDYGLIAAVLSADHHRAEHVARQLNVGAAHVNGPSVGDEPHVPFGGLAMSGYGRLGGDESVRTFTEQRSLYLHGAQ